MSRRVRDDLWRWELRLARCTWEERVRRWRRAAHQLLRAGARGTAGELSAADLPLGEWPTAPMDAVE